MGQDKPKGFVMVLGGGIAGIQASLSLSDAGYGVYLVERTAALGGMMSGLYRIYPLCTCCKLDPRIAACQQDPNIRVMVDTSVSDISGELGDFKVSLSTGGREEEIRVGAVVLAAGIETFEPSRYDTYAYGRLANVITSVEYEQAQKPLGPERGVPKRPSDGKAPEKVAWLQCVGSRDINRCDAPYCSSVCCMHALKEAVNTKETNEDIETTIFYMDMRTHGKGFEDYLNAAKSRGVNLVRSRVHTVDPVPGSDDLSIAYADDAGTLHQETFDLVVLSVGLRPPEDAVALARKIGVDMNDAGFVATPPFSPVSTSIPGIFVAGGMSGPIDIGQSVTQAAAAVSEIAACLDAETFSPPAEYPECSSSPDETPAVLVAYHLCPGMPEDLGRTIEAHAKGLSGVVGVSGTGGDVRSAIAEALKKTGANRLAFAGCTPCVFQGPIEEALRSSGIHPCMYETVDLRLLDAGDPGPQIRERLRLGVGRAMLSSPPPAREVPVEKNALVVGGGVAGLESALSLAREGFPVTLVEKENVLGGHGRHVRATWDGLDARKYLEDLISAVEARNDITVMTGTTVKSNRGFAGRFVTTLSTADGDREITHGVAILAPGGDPLKPGEYLYGANKNVYLWSELSARMMEDPKAFEAAGTAVFIQCVGSREPSCAHCSNFCCSFAVRTAIDLKQGNPDMNIYILYREMRTFGERENLYREAREKGIIFIRYDLDAKPVVEPAENTDRLNVTVFDPILDGKIRIEADFISLQSAIRGTNNPELARIFRLNLDENGFLSESPEKMKPVDTSTEGIYMAGLAAYPKDTAESIAQARAAAARALEVLAQDTVEAGGAVAEVMPEKCAVCCTCVRTCPFGVPYIDHETGAAFIDPGLCRGCGMCVAECPGKAIVMSTCGDRMLTAAPSLLMETA